MKQLNEYTFGNPTIEQLKGIEEFCIVDDLFDELSDFPPPDNDGMLTRNELNTVATNLKDIAIEANAAKLKNYLLLQRHTMQSLSHIFNKDGFDVEKKLIEIFEDIMPLIRKLQFHYNRMRPSQLANIFDLALFPYECKNLNTPSYPASEAVYIIVAMEVLINHNPEKKELCDKVINEVVLAQLYLGQHLPSDIKFAEQVADYILRHHKFARKYAI